MEKTLENRPESEPQESRSVTLTRFQKGLIVAGHASTGDPQNNMPLLVEFAGAIDHDRLRAAFAQVVKKHTALRTRIHDRDTAEVIPAAEFPVETDIIPLAKADLQAWVKTASARPFDLTKRAFKSTLLDHGDAGFSWFLNMHHAVTDGRSAVLMVTETAKAYADGVLEGSDLYAVTPKPPSAPMTFDTVTRTGPLYFPTSLGGTHATQLSFCLSSDEQDLLNTAAKGGLSVFSPDLSLLVLHATALCVWIGKLTGKPQLTIGVLLHQRNGTNMDVIGPLAEVFPVTISCDPDDSFRTRFRKTADAVLRMLRHALPGSSPQVPVDVLLNYLPHSQSDVQFGDVQARIAYLFSGALDSHQVARYQIHKFATTVGSPVTAGDQFTHVIDLKIAPGQNGFTYPAAAHLKHALLAGVRSPDMPLDALDLSPPDEAEFVRNWENTPPLHGPETDVAALLNTALQGRHAPVLEEKDASLSGHELWRAAWGFARYLRNHGCGAGDRICLERAPGMAYVIASYGAVLAGCSFVPLDLSLTPQRRATLIDLAKPAMFIDMATDLDTINPADPIPDMTYQPTDEAYLLFTSGTSGTPKGVAISREGLSDYLRFALAAYFDAPAVAPLFGNMGFDLTITSLFCPILSGGRLIAIPDAGPAALSALAAQKDITWLKATPSHLEILQKILPARHAINTIVVGGEALGFGLVDALQRGGRPIRIFNEYGPTEAVVGCMIFSSDQPRPTGETNMPIGVPAPGVTLRIVDAQGNRVPPGVPGELLVSRSGMANGYLDGSTDAFITLDAKTFYRTGDLAYLNEDGQAVYLGRIDAQLKIGGVRLEPEEIEQALTAHPGVAQAVVRLWSPQPLAATRHCLTCGLPDNVPNVTFDADGICAVCRDFEQIVAQTESWFKTPQDMQAEINGRATDGPHDCLFLLSGGKDSTYALYRTVALGHRPYVLTLDNGYLSQDAKTNIKRAVRDLGVPHEFVTTSEMGTIFRESLSAHSNVCHGCFKTIYTLALQKAAELDIRAIVTGLSRGQLFETRLSPDQFRAGRFDANAIDDAVVAARKSYHRVDDTVRGIVDPGLLSDDSLFDRIAFIDFYRYHDVRLEQMLAYLADHTAWQRPRDTGRSSNCLINVAGIHTHLIEQGFHNYAIPYAWDVRLGHKTRDEAIAELTDHITSDEVDPILNDIDYAPAARKTLTAWVVLSEAEKGHLDPAALRRHLGGLLPAYAMPTAFVEIDAVPLSPNGKIDQALLPKPDRTVRAAAEIPLSFLTPTERTLIQVWEQVLKTSPIGPNDTFSALGGDSLSAVTMIITLSDRLGKRIPDQIAFAPNTLSELAATIDALDAVGSPLPPAMPSEGQDQPPALSLQEKSILFEHRSQPASSRYNVCMMARFSAPLDAERFGEALKAVARCHAPLIWTYGATRRRLPIDRAVDIRPVLHVPTREAAEKAARALQRHPFDLENGPLLRCLPMVLDGGDTVVALAVHHIACDHQSFAVLWQQLDDCYQDGILPTAPSSYASVSTWQEDRLTNAHKDFWLTYPPATRTGYLDRLRPKLPEPDALLTHRLSSLSDVYRKNVDYTPVAVSIAAAVVALRPLIGGDDVSIGLVSSSRIHPDAADLVGYFLNPLPLVIHCPLDATYESLLAEVTRTLAQVLPLKDYPFAQIVADRKEAGTPLPQLDALVAIIHDNPIHFAGARIDGTFLSAGDAVAPLTFFHEVHDTTPTAMLEYSGTITGSDNAQNLLGDFCKAIEQMIEDPNAAIFNARSDQDTGAMLIGPKPLKAPHILDAILSHVAHQPSASAVICGDETLSWQELDRQSAAIAAHLAAQGVGPGARVLISGARSVRLIAAIIGIMRSGAAYVPVNTQTPQARMRRIVETLGVTYALTDQKNTQLGCPSDELNRDWARAEAPEADHDLNSEAYVIFTSGSTGSPMGVPIRHDQLAASTAARQFEYATPPSQFLLLSDIGFDSSMVGIFWTLSTGGTLVLPTDQERGDIDGLAARLASGQISHTLCVPVLYAGFLKRHRGKTWPTQVILAGDHCPEWLVKAHFEKAPDSRLSNEFGPTEATVWATVVHYEPGASDDSVGHPIPGVWLGILDDAGALLPPGQQGRLAIGGPQVTSGYIGADLEKSGRFGSLPDSPDPFAPVPMRYVLSGDNALIRDDRLVLLGRTGAQLIVNGHRIGATEVEALVCATGEISHAVLTTLDPRPLTQIMQSVPPAVLTAALDEVKTTADPDSALRLALGTRHSDHVDLALVVETPTQPDTDAIRAALAQELPPYMVPTRIAWLPRFAVSINEKIDRKATVALALPKLLGAETTPSTPTFLQPQSPRIMASAEDLSAQILAVFRAELRNDQLTASQSFFDHGGHSLMGLNAVMAIEKTTGLSISTTQLYDTPTAHGLAYALLGDVPPAAVQPPQPRFHRDPLPLPEAGGYRTLNIPIQPNGTRPPIFAIHNLGENVEFFRHISEQLGPDQPFFGLGKPIKFSHHRKPSEMLHGKIDIHAVGHAYADEIMRMYPQGPILLTAHCGGVPFSHATAVELTRRGRMPALNIMLNDLHAPRLNHRYDNVVKRVWRQRWNQLKRDKFDLFITLPQRLGGIVKLRQQMITRHIENHLVRRAEAAGKPLSPRLTSRKYVEDSIALLYDFEHVPYAGPSVAIRSTKEPKFWLKDGADRGWGGVLSDWKEITIEGFGVEILFPPRVQDTAAEFRMMIDNVVAQRHPFDAQPQAVPPSVPVPDGTKADAYRIETADFSVELKLKHENAVAMPRIEQRNWLLNMAVRELAEEVDDLSRRGPEMIKTGGMATMTDRATAALRPEEIMENWQIPLMEAMADSVCARGGDILEIGYGRGVSAAMVQSHEIASHTIVDCNPHVIADANRWKRQFRNREIQIIDALWQDSLDQLAQYDGILFHTYPLDVEELVQNLRHCCTFAEEFFPVAARLLKPGGRFTYFAPERDSLSRRHQRALHSHFDTVELRLIRDLGLPPESRDAHWFNEITCITATAKRA